MYVCFREFVHLWSGIPLCCTHKGAMTPGLEERHSLFSEYQRSDKLTTFTLVSRWSCGRFSSSSSLNTTDLYQPERLVQSLARLLNLNNSKNRVPQSDDPHLIASRLATSEVSVSTEPKMRM